MDLNMILAITIFVIIFIIISLELLNKTVIVLLGAGIFVFMRILSQEEAFHHVDWNVIFLLIGMMIIVGITKTTGLFQYIAIKSAKFAKGKPIRILILLSLVTAVLSAFLDNVTTVLILTPVSILIAVELGISPVPFIIAEAIASNIGGTATLIGDPPNIMIGSAANISFLDFIINLGPVVLIILVAFSLVFFVIFRKKLVVTNERMARIMDFDESKSIENVPLLIKSLIVLTIVIVGFMLHGLLKLEPAIIALFGAALLMLLNGKKEVDEYFHDVEWGTIFFFIGLFILVGGLVELGVIKMLSKFILGLTKNNLEHTAYIIIWASGIISAFVDNIPYVATMVPLVQDMGKTLHLSASSILPIWFSLSLGSCLGGNGSLIGASANVVSAGISNKSGYKISFLEFTKYGSIIMIISLFISTIYVYFTYFFSRISM